MYDDTDETTNEDLSIFIQEFYKWVDLFGLRSIRYEFQIGDTDYDYARFSFNYAARTCGVIISDCNFPVEGREQVLRDSALHEFIEGALLGPLLVLAESRHYNEDELEGITHEIVYRLQYILRDKLCEP
jgi:hypothetical protein